MVARLGGDEFTVTIENPHSDGDVDRIARDILDKLALPFQLGGDAVFITACIGIAFYPDDCFGKVGDLLTCADQAMYMAKYQGRAELNYYTPEIQSKAVSRAKIVHDLRDAIRASQFALHYQPIVDLRTGTTNKAEALIRWEHPDRGAIRPDQFIPIAEDAGLIQEIGDWVMREASSQVLAWRSTICSDMQVSINVSPMQFRQNNNLSDSWLAYLEKIGLCGEALVLEITEGLLIEIQNL